MTSTVIAEHDIVVLNVDVPAHGLKRGDVGTVVYLATKVDGCMVEFTNLQGDTIAVVDLRLGDIRACESNDVPHARGIEPVAS